MSWLEPGVHVHIIGVGGAGMSGVARLLAEMGAVVTGSDARQSAVLSELRAAGVRVDAGHDATHGQSAGVVLWSPAVANDNVELVAARQRGALLVTRGELLAELGRLQRVIGLTGTHGKTTATSMMVHVCHAAGRDDSRLLGADVLGIGANGHWGRDDLVLEVDESYGTFAQVSPHGLGLLNVEADHLDHYGTLDALEQAFVQLVDRTSGPVVAWTDNEGARRVSDIAAHEVISVSTTTGSRWRVADPLVARRRSTFTLHGPSRELAIGLRVTGAHNIANAAVVAALALELDVPERAVVQGLAAFAGAPRRFQFLGTWRGVDVYEDYAHLPGEISATLLATRAAGYERITAVFQPHRVTRTLHLADSFAPSFDVATNVVVTDIYSAGEDNPTHATGEMVAAPIARRRPERTTLYAPSLPEAVSAIESLHDRSDVVVLLGAGDVATVARDLSGGVR